MGEMDSHSRPMFGGTESPWDPALFTASDDSIRGGKSFSRLDIETTSESGTYASFNGNLDPSILNAGFASQRTVANWSAPDLSGYGAFILDILRSDAKKYTLVVKDTVLDKRPDGRETSSTNWEHDFAVETGETKVVLPFKDFKPFYRGKEVDDAKPLDWGSIKRLAIMCRSFYGEQEGDFKLDLKSITAYRE